MPFPARADVPAGRAFALLDVVGAVPRWLVLLLAAATARVFTFGNPLVDIDEEFYLLVAQRMLDGGTLYVDLWDRKPVGLFLLYMPAALFGPEAGVWVYQAMALASVVLTALLVARLADRAGWHAGALAAALLYVFMLNFGDGQGGQAPVFYNLLTAAAVALILPRPGDAVRAGARRNRGVLALALVGIGLQIKYSLLFEGMFLGLWLMWREHRLGTPIARVCLYGGAMVVAALIPTALAGGAFAALGHGGAWTFANFGSILQRRSDPADVIAWSLFKIALMLVPLLVVGALGWRAWRGEREHREHRALLFGWLGAALFGLLVFGGYISHYALPVMLPASLCCAAWFVRGRAGAATMAGLLAVALAGGIYTTWSARAVRGDGDQLAAIVQAIGPGGDCIYVYAGPPRLYSFTRRCAPTPWLFPSHIGRERENGAAGMDQVDELDRIFATRPEFVVARGPYLGERAAVRRRLMRHLARDGYRLTGRYPLGRLVIDLYGRQAAPESAGAARRAPTSAS